MDTTWDKNTPIKVSRIKTTKADGNKTPFCNVDIKTNEIPNFLKNSNLCAEHQLKHLSSINLSKIMRGKSAI